MLLTAGGVVLRVQTRCRHVADVGFAEVAAVGCVGDRLRLALFVATQLDTGGSQVVERCLRQRYGLLLVVGSGGRFGDHDDLMRRVHHGLSVVAVVLKEANPFALLFRENLKNRKSLGDLWCLKVFEKT